MADETQAASTWGAPPPIENPTPVEEVVQKDPNDSVTVTRVVTPPKPTAPRDGTITGAPVYSDGHCPLLVDDADIDNRTIVEDHVNPDGSFGGQTVHRYAQQTLTAPTECPTCGKFVERHALVHEPLRGERDCAIAISSRDNPKYARLYAAQAAGNDELVKEEAAKLGAFGRRFLRVFVAGDPGPQEQSAQV